MANKNPLLAVAQFCATENVLKNTETCLSLLRQASASGACATFFPEASDFVARNNAETLDLTPKTSLEDAPFVTRLKEEAKRLNMWVSVGVHEKVPHQDRVYNTHLLIENEGGVKAAYRKLHLFDVDIKDGPRIMESDTTAPGSCVAPPVTAPFGNIGLAICYDVRFPELSQLLRKRGAHILTYPSAFTVPTGQAHWEILLRARAIETQTFVVAAAQSGKHNAKRESYGRSMIVDPWGKVLASCLAQSPDPILAIAEIDMSDLERIRSSMPVLKHRRTDLFTDGVASS